MAFSDRYFANKVVALWSERGGDGTALAEVVCNYFHFSHADWKHIASLDVSPLQNAADPMWAVTAGFANVGLSQPASDNNVGCHSRFRKSSRDLMA